MKTPCVLVTGFEPFDEETVNPSERIVRALEGEVIEGHRIVSEILPVSFEDAPVLLARAIETHQPALVVALGQAGGCPKISLERVAINLIDARIADNRGLQPMDTCVLGEGPGAYFSSLPLKAMQAGLQESGVPAAISLTAGSFVCNQVFYWLAHLLATEHPGVRGGFIHLPWLTEQAERHAPDPGMPLDTMLRGIRVAIACALRNETDLRVVGGATH